jgi:hypothetical protein
MVDLSDKMYTFETKSIRGDGNNLGVVLLRAVVIGSRL